MEFKVEETKNNFVQTASELLQIKEIPTTEVSEYVYGSKRAKSKLNQKKTGHNKLFLSESMRIIEFYVGLNNKIVNIIEQNKKDIQ